MNTQEIAALLEQYPALKEQIIKMLKIVEGPKQGHYSKADDIEEQTIEVVRKTGQDIIKHWAQEQATETSMQLEKKVSSAKKNVKKKSTGRPHLDK